MIWVGGRVVPDEALKVSVLDRTFEHGLGLFETLRTWNGRAPLLDRHMARMARSARELGLPYATVVPPDDKAVAGLVEAAGLGDEVVLRITLSGGLSEAAGATLWMRAAPLPPLLRRGGAVVDLGSWLVNPVEPLARFKSLNYWSRRRAHESALALRLDEVLSFTGAAGVTKVWEGSRTNVFAVKGNTLRTPGTGGPIVPGVMREVVIERAVERRLDVEETHGLRLWELTEADEVFLTNSVRGVVPVARLMVSGREETHNWPAPGPVTRDLSLLVSAYLEPKGGPT